MIQLLHQSYDPKTHASCLTAHKQIVQTVFKKIEKAVKVIEAGGVGPRTLAVDERIQLQMAVRSLMVATKLFPSSFKNILAGKASSAKKDSVTSVLEQIIKLFLPLGASGAQIVEHTL